MKNLRKLNLPQTSVIVVSRFCREARGGCGRELVMVQRSKTYKPAVWSLPSTRNSKVIIHLDDILPGEETLNIVGHAKEATFSRLRLKLEESCKGKRQRGEL